MLSRQILRRSLTTPKSRCIPSLSTFSCCRPISHPIITTSTSTSTSTSQFTSKSFHTTSVVAMNNTTTASHEPVQMKVKAIYLPNLDILSFMSSAYPSHPRHIDKTCTVIALETTPAERTHHLSSDVKLGSLTPKQQKEQAITSSTIGTNLEVFNALSPYIILFEYGSIVFFNATEEQQSYALQKLTSLGYPASSSKDDYNIVLQPNLDRVCQLVPDKALLQSLDFNSLRVISQILAQTVAMDYYEQKVGPLMTDFRTLNEKLKDSGDLQDKKEIKHKLFKLIASNNLIMTDVLTQLKVLDRSDIAWRYGIYDSLWVELRKEFDLKDRFDALELKLDIISNNTLFFLEALHNKKSSRLEWIIIILIAAEIFLNLYEKVENYVEKLTGDQLVEALVPQIRITTPHQEPIPVHITAPPHIATEYAPRETTATSTKTPTNTITATPTATTTPNATQSLASTVAPTSTPSIPTPTLTAASSSTPDEDAEIAALKNALAQLAALSRESSDTPSTSSSTLTASSS